MSFKIAEVVLASAVASAGTFTASYPDNTSAGDYAPYGHSLYARGLQAEFTQDAGKMSVSFGASDITVTYSGSTSIPSGTTVTVQLNMRGADDKKNPTVLTDMERMSFAPVVRIDLGAPNVADADGVSASQTVTGAGTAFLLNGALADASGDFVEFDVPRNVVAAWTNTAVLTITGKDEYNNTVVETSASGTSHTGKKAFKKITSVTTSATVTSATIGTGDVLGLPVYVEKVGQILGELQDEVLLANFGAGKIIVPFDFNETDLLAPTAQNLVSPVAGYITGLYAIVQKAVTTGGAITVEANTVAVVGLSVTVADADAAGVVKSDTVLKIATGLVAAGDDITVTPAAAFATAGAVKGFIVIEPLGALNGTFVAGVQTAATGTTGDVRGTYDPAEACNGSLSFSLLALLPDPTYQGADQYDG